MTGKSKMGEDRDQHKGVREKIITCLEEQDSETREIRSYLVMIE